MHLKRPATIHLQEGLFIPEGVDLEEVDRRWQKRCLQNPSCFDGTLLHVLGAQRNGCGGANVHVMPCSYRFFAVQDAFYNLGIRPLGVKGITRFDSKILWGKRSNAVHHYAGQWECAPSGSVEPGHAPEETIQKELLEETGLSISVPPIAVALLFDEEAKTWELIYRLHVKGCDCVSNGEYVEYSWKAKNNVPGGVTPISRLMHVYS